jgi:amidase
MLPIADGSDFGGSLRNPAGWNNVIGMRPSQGLVPTWPAEDAFAGQLGVEGPMARNVADLALLLGVLAGHDPRAPLSRDLPDDFAKAASAAATEGAPERAASGARIGWLGDLGGHLAYEPGILELTEQALAIFEALGARVEPVTPAFDFEALWRSFIVLRAGQTGATLKPLYDDPAKRALMKPEAVYEVETALSLSALDVAKANRARTAWYHAVRGLFDRFDALVLPTALVTPFPIERDWPKQIAGRRMDSYHRWLEVAAPATLAGCPVIALPAGFGGSDGARLPMGLQLIGRPRGDLALLRLAAAYEAACPFLAESPL